MVSLSKLCRVSEDGVSFSAPHASGEILLRPEDAIHIQNAIHSNIAVMLDDVVPSTYVGPRVQEAMERTIRWLDRAIVAHRCGSDQAIFPIVQGGLDQDLRATCAREMVRRLSMPRGEVIGGFAIGGLSGGEAKDTFWRSVRTSARELPDNMPRYCMGVGYAEDIAVCIALGVDMFDCVFPTRTARFGVALTWAASDAVGKWRGVDQPIDGDCGCWTCKHMSKASLYHIRDTPMCGQLLTLHNVEFQGRLTAYFRDGIKKGQFPKYEIEFMKRRFPEGNYPQWIVDALASEGIQLDT
jgi:queuine tRNA-ribosyltransferase